MDLHGQIMNINPEKRKQNLAIDEAVKKHKNLHEIMVAVYARAFRDCKHAAAEIAAQHSVQLTMCQCGDDCIPMLGEDTCVRCDLPLAHSN